MLLNCVLPVLYCFPVYNAILYCGMLLLSQNVKLLHAYVVSPTVVYMLLQRRDYVAYFFIFQEI